MAAGIRWLPASKGRRGRWTGNGLPHGGLNSIVRTATGSGLPPGLERLVGNPRYLISIGGSIQPVNHFRSATPGKTTAGRGIELVTHLGDTRAAREFP